MNYGQNNERSGAMKRKNLYIGVSIVTYAVSAYVISRYFVHEAFGAMICATPCILIGLLLASVFDSYLTSSYPGFLYTPYEDRVKMAMKRKEKRDAEESKMFEILENELLYPYTSLGWKYKRICDFCYEHPKFLKRLKESERYITWRTDVVDWAKSNLYRLDGFYLRDGVVDYIYDSEYQNNGLVDLIAKYESLKDDNCVIVCEIDFKRKRLPKDYFEFPGLVWESEDMDGEDYVVRKNRTTDGEALSFGAGLAAGLELFDSNESDCGEM